MPLPSVLALAALAMGMIRVALPHSGLNVPIWVARGTLILALVFLTVALVGFFWPVLGAYRLELVSRGGGGNAAEMTWPLALACAGIAYGALTVGGRLMTRADPEVRILSPLGGHVDWKHDLYGSVFPPDAPVQVFVFSRDKRWYPKKAEVNDAAWRIPGCQIGDERVPPDGFKYQLVAVSGADEITAARTTLPRGAARSRVVRVLR